MKLERFLFSNNSNPSLPVPRSGSCLTISVSTNPVVQALPSNCRYYSFYVPLGGYPVFGKLGRGSSIVISQNSCDFVLLPGSIFNFPSLSGYINHVALMTSVGVSTVFVSGSEFA